MYDWVRHFEPTTNIHIYLSKAVQILLTTEQMEQIQYVPLGPHFTTCVTPTSGYPKIIRGAPYLP